MCRRQGPFVLQTIKEAALTHQLRHLSAFVQYIAHLAPTSLLLLWNLARRIDFFVIPAGQIIRVRGYVRASHKL